MAKKFLGMSLGGDNKIDREDQKNAERVQDYLNKFKLDSRDISVKKTKKKTVAGNTWQGYSWVREATTTTKERSMRYHDYREMCKVPELNLGLSIYADNSTQRNPINNVIEIQSNNNKIVEILSNLFFETLDINSNLWGYSRNMCKLGDEFLEVCVDNKENPKHILSLERFTNPNKLDRVEDNGNLQNFTYKESEDEENKRAGGGNSFAKQETEMKVFMPWQVVHFKIDEEDFAPMGKSIFESGRRTWKQLSLMEDAMLIYRISRAPERRIFYIDVGNLSTKDANLFIEQQKRKFRKKSYINPSTGEIDEKANALCITLDTKIPLLDGRSLTLQQLINEQQDGKENWVYSIDTNNNNQIVPGKIIWAGETRKNTTLIKVTLDNGEYIKCTPDHRFMNRDGSFTEAQNLKVDDSMMPLYRKLSSIEEGNGIKGYELVLDPSDNKYKYTHMISDFMKTNEINEIKKRGRYVRHHIDFNKRNNNPNNIKIMELKEHFIYHSKLIEKTLNTPENIIKATKRLIKYNHSNKHKQDVSKANIKRNSIKSMEWYNNSDLHQEHNKIRSANLKKQFSDPELRKKYIDGMNTSNRISDNFWTTLIDIAKNTKLNKQKFVSFTNVINNALLNTDLINEWNSFCQPRQKDKLNRNFLGRAIDNKYNCKTTEQFLNEICEVPTKNNRAVYQNHKVSKIEWLSEKEDTGDITIDKYHNFATLTGVFIHNSVDEDFFIAVRENSQGTRIDTLPGGCLTLDTKIDSLDGNSYSLSEMIDKYKNNEEQWVYSTNPENGDIVPGIVSWAGITHKNVEIMEIVLDNGEIIRCTPDHKFPIWGKGKTRADKLIENDSIIAHNKMLSSIKKGDRIDNYEKIYNHKNKKHEYTHRIVAKTLKDTDKYNYFIHKNKEKLTTIHHRNLNKRDNTPNNLVWMGNKDHFKYHSDNTKAWTDGYKKWWNNLSEEEIIEFTEKTQKGREKVTKNFIKKLRTDKIFALNFSKKCSISVKNYINSLSKEDKEKRAIQSRKAFKLGNIAFNKKMNDDLEFRNNVLEKRSRSISESFTDERKIKQSKLNKKMWLHKDHYNKVFKNSKIKFDEKLLTKFIDIFNTKKNYTETIDWINHNKNNDFTKHLVELNKDNIGNFNPYYLTSKFTKRFLINFNYENVKDFSNNIKLRNHRVVSIKKLNYKEDVGTLTIDQDEKYHSYHTFALTAGIYTYNSSLGEVDDVKYFRDRILKTMGIPPAYMGGAEGGGGFDYKAFLSQQDVQFARIIERIQKFLIKGLEKIAIIELALQKIDEDELKNFKIKLTPPSNVDQLMEIEIKNQQFALISTMKAIVGVGEGTPFLPDEWIYENVLGFNPHEINKIKLQNQMQAQLMASQAALAGGAGEGGMGGGTTGGTAPGVAGGPSGMASEAPPEQGGEEEGGETEPSLDVASNTIEFDGNKWLFENAKDAKKLIKYVSLYEKVHKDNKEYVANEFRNSVTRMAIEGEFRGLMKVSYSKNGQKTLTENLKINEKIITHEYPKQKLEGGK